MRLNLDIQKAVNDQLNSIHRKRNRSVYLPNLLLLILSVYFQRELLVVDDRYIATIVIMVLGSIIRISVNEWFFEKWERKVSWVRGLNILAFFLLGFAWSLHFSDILYHYGTFSPNASYTLLIIIGFITGASNSLGGSKEVFLSYVGTMCTGIILSFILSGETKGLFGVAIVVLYFFFTLRNFNISYQQLCDSLKSQLLSQMEKDRVVQIIDAVPGFVGLINKDGICYMANKTTLSLYPDIIGKKIGDIDSTSSWEKYVFDFLKSDKTFDVSEQTTSYGGNTIHALLNGQKVEDGGVVIVSVITTELVEARNKIREQEAQSHYTAKLVSLGEMAAGIAHEINNPLTIIQGYANVMQKLLTSESPDKDAVKMVAGKISDTTERISKTIRSLKTLSRNAEKDPMEDVDIRTVFQNCLDICEQRFRNHGVDLRLPSEIPEIIVRGKEVQLSQVLMNLLNNGVDAAKETKGHWVEIKLEKSDLWFDILVLDSGTGIPKDIKGKIMNPFFTTKDVGEGTGLGLSISRKIMEEHKGELSLIENSPYTTFRMRLPT